MPVMIKLSGPGSFSGNRALEASKVAKAAKVNERARKVS